MQNVTVKVLGLVLVVASAAAAVVAGGAKSDSERTSAAQGTLTCADETPPGVRPRFGAGSATRNFGPLALDAVGGWASAKPVGIQLVSQGKHYSLLKAFAYVLRRPPGSVTMTVQAPTTVSLYYVAGTVWAANPSARQIVKAKARSVRFSACVGPTGYTGGLLIQTPACVTLRVGVTGLKARTIRPPIAPAHCRT